jgi:hypothetical protein
LSVTVAVDGRPAKSTATASAANAGNIADAVSETARSGG